MERDALAGCMYANAEIQELLYSNGINDFKFYSVLPDLDFPQLIYAHEYNPVEELTTKYIPTCNNPDTVFLDEGFIYGNLVQDGLFHAIANLYLIEYLMNGKCAPVKHVTVFMDRGRKNAMFAVIKDDKVEKSSLS